MRPPSPQIEGDAPTRAPLLSLPLTRQVQSTCEAAKYATYTAYDILRHNGLQIGKTDFLTELPFRKD